MASIIRKLKYYNGSAGGTSPPIDTTGANLLVILRFSYKSTDVAPSDSYGNGWSAPAEYGSPNTNGYCRVYYKSSPMVGPGHTFTFIDNVAYPWPTICVYALSGMKVTGAFDTISGHDDRSTGLMTPSEPGELLLSVFGRGTVGDYTPDGAWQVDFQQSFSSGVCFGGATALINVYNSTAPIECTWMTSDVATDVSAAVAFKCLKPFHDLGLING